MSGIYIPDMEMPKSCLGELNGKNDCPLVGICGIFKATPFKEKEKIVWEQRLKDCPLVEVPPHGDLIKREDALTALMDTMCGTGYQSMAMSVIRSEMTCPTIIEASN